MMEDPPANFDNLPEDRLDQILSYFPLSDLTTFRQVSRPVRESCQRRKRLYQNLLIKNKSVQIIGLQSAKGKELNGRLAIIDGTPNVNNQNRYPILICHLTGETERLSMKLINLHPFLNPQEELQVIHRQRFLDYTKDSKVREGHGRFLDQILMLMRFAINNMQQIIPGDFNSFMDLSRSDQRIARLNSQVFTMYRVKPVDAGFSPGTNLDKSLLVKTIASLLGHEVMSIDYFGKMARYPPDGVGGRWVVRNLVRFLRAWDTERISGDFWIVKICPTGTLLVKNESDDDDVYRPASGLFGHVLGGSDGCSSKELGNVYLVKGMGSTVGEDIPPSQFPILVRTTFLPIYDFLVYDGVMSLPTRPMPTSQDMKKKIKAHVERAIREDTVVFCGESASKGLWSDDPPEVNLEEIEAEEEQEDESYESSPEELKSAMNLARFCQSIGYKSLYIQGKGGTDQAPILCVRRFGYTLEDNPGQQCGLRFTTQPEHLMHLFQFKQWPTYTIMELLPEVLEVCQTCRVAPGMIWVDEKSLIVPMRVLLKKAFQEIGFDEEIQVKWYPPPSKEEEEYNNRFLH